MRQMTLAHQAEFQRYAKKTRREQFLEEMDAVMPWAELFSLVMPHYSKGEMGRKPVGLEIMLRVYFLQQWFFAVRCPQASFTTRPAMWRLIRIHRSETVSSTSSKRSRAWARPARP